MSDQPNLNKTTEHPGQYGSHSPSYASPYPAAQQTSPGAYGDPSVGNQPYVPVRPPASLIPIWVTVIVTLFGGLIGLLPAYLGEEALKQNNMATGSHWRAFLLSLILPFVIFVLFFFGLFAFSTALESATYSIS